MILMRERVPLPKVVGSELDEEETVMGRVVSDDSGGGGE
jgi:hypothetical protein